MALDIHIGCDKDNANRHPPALSFPEWCHGRLFNSPEFRYIRWKEDFPQLDKLQDYYQDVFYVLGETKTLQNELDAIIEFVENKQLVLFLKKFRTVCTDAIQQDCGIFCFAD